MIPYQQNDLLLIAADRDLRCGEEERGGACGRRQWYDWKAEFLINPDMGHDS